MTATVFLVRHAAHVQLGHRLTGRQPHVPLSEDGVAQAARLASRLSHETIAAIHASPLDRAAATAAAISATIGVAVEPAPAINEIDFGRWTGTRFDDLEGDAAWHRWNEARASACVPGGESMAAAQRRAVTHVESVAVSYAGRAVVLVSHCDIIRAIVAHYLRLSLDDLLRFDIDPASVSTLQVGSWGARITGLNEKPCQ